MKNLLIMVQACASYPYTQLMKAQQDTWDSIEVEGVTTLYYHGSKEEGLIINRHDSMVYASGTSDEYEAMHWKFKKAMDYAWDWDWDFVLRTNASTYINKRRVLNFIQNKPTEKYYSGIDCGGFVSGTNALLSRDCVDIARKQFSEDPHPAEDVYLGEILLSNGVEIVDGISRPHYDFNTHKIIEADSYRCKSPDADRSKDAIAFHNIFKHLNHGK